MKLEPASGSLVRNQATHGSGLFYSYWGLHGTASIQAYRLSSCADFQYCTFTNKYTDQARPMSMINNPANFELWQSKHTSCDVSQSLQSTNAYWDAKELGSYCLAILTWTNQLHILQQTKKHTCHLVALLNTTPTGLQSGANV